MMERSELALMGWLDLMGRGYFFLNNGKIYPPHSLAWGHIPLDVCRSLIRFGYVYQSEGVWVINGGGMSALTRWEKHKQWLIDIQAD